MVCFNSKSAAIYGSHFLREGKLQGIRNDDQGPRGEGFWLRQGMRNMINTSYHWRTNFSFSPILWNILGVSVNWRHSRIDLQWSKYILLLWGHITNITWELAMVSCFLPHHKLESMDPERKEWREAVESWQVFQVLCQLRLTWLVTFSLLPPWFWMVTLD